MATRIVKSAADFRAATEALKQCASQVSEALLGAGAKEVYDSGTAIHSRSVELAPVDTGDLRGSGYMLVNGDMTAGDGSVLSNPSLRGGHMELEIGFASKYAWNQHEHIEYDHPKGGEAKYLEKAFDEEAGFLQGRMKTAMKEKV